MIHPRFSVLFDHALQRVSREAREVMEETMWRECVERALRRDLAWCDDMEFAQGFATHCPVDGAFPKDYLHRILQINEHLALVGVRFKGGDLACPFVDILAHTMPSHDSACFGALLHEITQEFALFSVDTVRILSGSDSEPWPRGWAGQIDQHIVAGRRAHIARGEVDAQLWLDEVSSLDDAIEFIQHHYARTFTQSAILEDAITPADRDDLEECTRTGHVVWMMHGATRVGVLATYANQGQLCQGQCVMEELVAPAHRGHGIAAQAQALMAREFDDDLLWGTIDARNVASLRVAERAGRRRIAAWHWLTHDS